MTDTRTKDQYVVHEPHCDWAMDRCTCGAKERYEMTPSYQGPSERTIREPLTSDGRVCVGCGRPVGPYGTFCGKCYESRTAAEVTSDPLDPIDHRPECPPESGCGVCYPPGIKRIWNGPDLVYDADRGGELQPVTSDPLWQSDNEGPYDPTLPLRTSKTKFWAVASRWLAQTSLSIPERMAVAEFAKYLDERTSDVAGESDG